MFVICQRQEFEQATQITQTLKMAADRQTDSRTFVTPQKGDEAAHTDTE